MKVNFNFIQSQKKFNPEKIVVSVETPAHKKRLSKPYIGIVDFSNDGKMEVRWGNWLGNHGEAGLLVVEAKAGDIIIKGQKDNLDSAFSVTEYFQLKEDGSLGEPFNRLEAYKRSKANQSTLYKFDNEERKIL